MVARIRGYFFRPSLVGEELPEIRADNFRHTTRHTRFAVNFISYPEQSSKLYCAVTIDAKYEPVFWSTIPFKGNGTRGIRKYVWYREI